MWKNTLMIAVVAVAAYLVGVESAKSRGKNYEDLRHQVERLWLSPDAKKARRRMGKQAKQAAKQARKSLLGS
ncbi:hypothetical protein [Leucobacter komagatae]|uniref:Uncharacterized protein n=1 Tax=Leucobacter komagatae TaxID=55969 RepID=A0A0D0ITH1_9MICO|nr:hypothetical protein [Leucobacter komagatae]KIP52823.1 hypothetical protein SD72_06285 [Leucobacter komagatae]